MCPVEAELFVHADERTDVMKLTGDHHNFANTPKTVAMTQKTVVRKRQNVSVDFVYKFCVWGWGGTV